MEESVDDTIPEATIDGDGDSIHRQFVNVVSVNNHYRLLECLGTSHIVKSIDLMMLKEREIISNVCAILTL